MPAECKPEEPLDIHIKKLINEDLTVNNKTRKEIIMDKSPSHRSYFRINRILSPRRNYWMTQKNLLNSPKQTIKPLVRADTMNHLSHKVGQADVI